MTKVVPLRKPDRKEVVEDSVNADTILLRMYSRRIDKLFCFDCIDQDCTRRGTGWCYYQSKRQ